MPWIAGHDVALAELDTSPDGAIAAFAAFLRGNVDSGCSSDSQQQQPADGKFQFAAGTAAKLGASRSRQKARTRQQPPVLPQALAAPTPAAARLAACGVAMAGFIHRSGIAASACGSAAATSPTTRGAPLLIQQQATTFQLREQPQAVSCASHRASVQSAMLQQQVGAAAEASTASQPVRQPERRSRGWWPPWDDDSHAARGFSREPAPDAAAGKARHAARAHNDTQQDGSPTSRSTVYDSADSLQAMTSQVTSTGHRDGLVRVHLIAQRSWPDIQH